MLYYYIMRPRADNVDWDTQREDKISAILKPFTATNSDPRFNKWFINVDWSFICRTVYVSFMYLTEFCRHLPPVFISKTFFFVGKIINILLFTYMRLVAKCM